MTLNCVNCSKKKKKMSTTNDSELRELLKERDSLQARLREIERKTNDLTNEGEIELAKKMVGKFYRKKDRGMGEDEIMRCTKITFSKNHDRVYLELSVLHLQSYAIGTAHVNYYEGEECVYGTQYPLNYVEITEEKYNQLKNNILSYIK